jgi:hypothetical protein
MKTGRRRGCIADGNRTLVPTPKLRSWVEESASPCERHEGANAPLRRSPLMSITMLGTPVPGCQETLIPHDRGPSSVRFATPSREPGSCKACDEGYDDPKDEGRQVSAHG